MNLIRTFWLLLFSGLFAFAAPNTKRGGSILIYDYDERVQVSMRYDGTSFPALDYHSGLVPVPDEKENPTAGSVGLFPDFAEFVAAKTGGRLGSDLTRGHVAEVAAEMESRGWTITGGGGRLPEEYLAGPGGGRLGSSFPDITATKNGRTLRVNTVDTYVDGLTPTTREAVNAARIRSQTPGDHLLLVPKPKP